MDKVEGVKKEKTLYTDEEQRILEQVSIQPSITRREVDVLLECSESKSNTLLKHLHDAKLIDQIGKGKQTRYSLRA